MDHLRPPVEHDEDDISGPINFLARLPLYATVKPYVMRNDPKNGFPPTNIENEQHRVKIRNMRTRELSYEKCGFHFCSMSTAMKYEDYQDQSLIESVHFPEVEAVLKNALGAAWVRIINYGQRKRHESFPISTGEIYEHMQPATRAHLDFSFDTCSATIRRMMKSQADEFLTGRWQYVNVWHPLRGPLYDWPLAVCDASTVNFAEDTMAADVVGLDREEEEVQLQHNPDQQWYWLPGQLPSELLIFKNVDGQAEKGASFGTPHTAFDLDTHSGQTFTRESIEMRALVAW